MTEATTQPLLYNPRVFTPYDRALAWETLRCPFCGTVEPNEMLLGNNHWIRQPDHDGYDWCAENGMCIGQNLVTNHIGYYAKAMRDRDPDATGFKEFKEDECRANLLERSEVGRRLGIDPAKIIAHFTDTVCGPCGKGEHGDCFEDLTWSALADGTVTCACAEAVHHE